MASAAARPSVSVIIPAYTLDRWELLVEAVSSAQRQTVPPAEVIVCIDHNDELYRKSSVHWSEPRHATSPPVRVLCNDEPLESVGAGAGAGAGASAHARAHGVTRRFGAGTTRNVAAASAGGEVLAFLDDDARANDNWLAELLAPYREPGTVAVGGAPIPHFQTARPSWFPAEFDWVFGCAYEGLPTEVEPTRRLIGANMSVRADAFRALGGFHSIDFDDLDLCMRVAARFGHDSVIYAPNAVVRHFVPSDRVTWRYFWRRCYYVNREKVLTFNDLGSAADLDAERSFVLRALKRRAASIGRLARGGDTAVVTQTGAMLVGITAAGAGHAAGRMRYRRG